MIVQDEPMGSKDKFWCQLPDDAADGGSNKPHRACLGGFGPLHYAEDRRRRSAEARFHRGKLEGGEDKD